MVWQTSQTFAGRKFGPLLTDFVVHSEQKIFPQWRQWCCEKQSFTFILLLTKGLKMWWATIKMGGNSRNLKTLENLRLHYYYFPIYLNISVDNSKHKTSVQTCFQQFQRKLMASDRTLRTLSFSYSDKLLPVDNFV